MTDREKALQTLGYQPAGVLWVRNGEDAELVVNDTQGLSFRMTLHYAVFERINALQRGPFTIPPEMEKPN